MYNQNQSTSCSNDNYRNAPTLLQSLEQRELSICNSGVQHLHYPEAASSGMSTAATTITTATPSVTATTTSSSSSSFRIPTTLHMESAVANSNSMIDNTSNHLQPQYPRSSSISRVDGRYHLRRNNTGPSMQLIQLFNVSNRFNNNNSINNNSNSNSNSNSSSHHNNSSSNENPNSNHNTDSLRWGGSSGGSHKLLFTLNDSIASFAASPPPLLHSTSTSNTFHHNIDEDYAHNPCTSNNTQNMASKNINNTMSSSNHLNNKSNHIKMSRRPSVFTTLSGSRFYMDDSKGEPIPVPASIIQPSAITTSDYMDPNRRQIRRQSTGSQLTLISNLSSSQHHPANHQLQENDKVVLEDDPIFLQRTAQRQHHINNHNQNHHHQTMPYPPPSMSHQRHPLDGSSSHRGSYGRQLPPQPQPSIQQKFRNPMMHPHHHTQSLPQDSHHSQHKVHDIPPQLQQMRSPTTGTQSSTPLKSVVMIDRIPPPIPPLTPYIRGIEMNCKMDILSAPIGRRYVAQNQSLTGPMAQNSKSYNIASAFAVGTSMLSSDSTNNNDSSSPLRIPYHSYMIECPQCHGAMIVSKFCIVVQCPQCRTISPCEATTLSITMPRMYHKTSSNAKSIDPRM
jgi:hypothetical protein